MLPDYPNNPNPRAFWFNNNHAEIAMHRLARHGRAEPKAVSWAGAKYDTILSSIMCCDPLTFFQAYVFHLGDLFLRGALYMYCDRKLWIHLLRIVSQESEKRRRHKDLDNPSSQRDPHRRQCDTSCLCLDLGFYFRSFTS